MLLINLVNVGSFRGGKVIVLKINEFLENKSRIIKKFFFTLIDLRTRYDSAATVVDVGDGE